MFVYLEQALALVLPDTVVQHVSHPCRPARFSAEDHRPRNRKTHPTKIIMYENTVTTINSTAKNYTQKIASPFGAIFYICQTAQLNTLVHYCSSILHYQMTKLDQNCH